MELGPIVVSLLYQGLATAAFLILCSIGLMIVLGMMNIINLAHGEIMMNRRLRLDHSGRPRRTVLRHAPGLLRRRLPGGLAD